MVCAKFIFTNYYLSSDINVDVLELGFKYFDLYPALFGSVSSQHVVKRIYLLLPKKNEVGVCPLVRVSVVAVCPPVARTGSPFARGEPSFSWAFLFLDHWFHLGLSSSLPFCVPCHDDIALPVFSLNLVETNLHFVSSAVLHQFKFFYFFPVWKCGWS